MTRSLHQEIIEYLERIAPEKKSIAKHYKSRVPIFDFYGIEKQIKTSFGTNCFNEKRCLFSY